MLFAALNLNPHLHIICPDGAYTKVNDRYLFREVKSISDTDVCDLIETIAKKVIAALQKQGYLDPDGVRTVNPRADPLFQDNELMLETAASSVVGKIAFGPNAGKYVTRIGSGFGYSEEIPLVKEFHRRLRSYQAFTGRKK